MLKAVVGAIQLLLFVVLVYLILEKLIIKVIIDIGLISIIKFDEAWRK